MREVESILQQPAAMAISHGEHNEAATAPAPGSARPVAKEFSPYGKRAGADPGPAEFGARRAHAHAVQFVNVGLIGLDQQLRTGRPEQLLYPPQECSRVAADADIPVDQQRVLPPALAWQSVED